MMYSLINKSSVFITYCFVDGSVSIGDVCIHLRKPVSPELVPVKYGEFLYFKTNRSKENVEVMSWLTNPSKSNI